MFKKVSATLIILFTAIIAVFGKNGLLEYFEMKNQIKDLRGRLRDLKSDYVEEGNVVYGLTQDDTFLEKHARENLKMSKANEKVYLFNDEKSAR